MAGGYDEQYAKKKMVEGADITNKKISKKRTGTLSNKKSRAEKKRENEKRKK